jgi:hypothetical protein
MSKKNEQKESCGGVKMIRERHRKIKSALNSCLPAGRLQTFNLTNFQLVELTTLST